MAAAAGGDVRAGIGTRLRAAREKKGLTILQTAEKLHVDPRIVEALEAEDFAALGAAVYARGHLRHYAELVGEQTAELQELYSNSTRAAPTQPDLTRISRPPPDPDAGKLAGPAVIVLVAIAAVGSLWWLVTHPGDKPVPAVVQSGPPAGPPAQAESQSAAAPVVSDSAAARPPASGATNIVDARQASPALAKTAKTGPTMAAPTTAPPTSRGKEGQLTLKFSSDSWAEVYDAAGNRLFYDVGTASTAHTVKGPAPMRIVLGNGAGVTLEFNGRATPVPASASADGSVRFVINAHGRAVPATNGE